MKIIFIFLVLSVIQLILMTFFVEKSDRKISVADKLGMVGFQRYKWGIRIFIIVLISITILSFTQYYSEMTMNRIYLAVGIVSLCIRAMLEWKYIRETKRHKVTASMLILIVLVAIYIFSLKPL